jgi:hypothetical protein
VNGYVSDFPPNYILSGPNRGKGTADRRLQICIERLPQFQHRIVVANPATSIEQMKTEPNICNAALPLRMLVHQNEFEAVIGYPAEMRYLTRQLELDEKDCVFLPAAEEPPLLDPYVACSKSDVGRQITVGINRILADEAVYHPMAADYETRLDDETTALFRQLRGHSRFNRLSKKS